jgi:hypothetical protein
LALHGWHGRVLWGVNAGYLGATTTSNFLFVFFRTTGHLLSSIPANRAQVYKNFPQYFTYQLSWPILSQPSIEYAQWASKVSGSWRLKRQTDRSQPQQTTAHDGFPPSCICPAALKPFCNLGNNVREFRLSQGDIRSLLTSFITLDVAVA